MAFIKKLPGMALTRKSNITITSAIQFLLFSLVVVLVGGSYVLLKIWGEGFYLERVKFSHESVVGGIAGSIDELIENKDIPRLNEKASNYLNNPEIVSIEVIDNSGQTIFKKDRLLSGESVELVPIVKPIFTSTKLGQNGLNENPKYLGEIKVLMSRQSASELVSNGLSKYYLVYLIIISALLTLLYIFFKSIHRSVTMITASIERIENGNADLKSPRTSEVALREVNQILSALDNLAVTVASNKESMEKNLNDMQTAKAEAETLMLFKEQFIKSISHDIRTPVGVIKGLIGLISSDLKAAHVSKETKQYLEYCLGSANTLEKIVNDLFAYEKFSDEEHMLNVTECQIGTMIRDLHNLHEMRFADSNINLITTINERIHDVNVQWVKTDVGKVTRIIENLVDNAHKYTKVGSVIISWAVNQEKIHIQVKDSGVGINGKDLQFIFRKHFTVSPENQNSGRGLGLFYVKTFVDILGGIIKVESQLGLGTTFTIEIPVEAIEDKPDSTAKLSVSDENVIRATIIDDRIDNCKLLEAILGKLGVVSDCHQIPELGYEAIKQNMPDIIFLDYHMEGISGDILAKKIRDDLDKPNHVPLICVTADVSESTFKKLTGEGHFESIITKPFNLSEINAIVKALKKSRSMNVWTYLQET